MKQFDVFSVTCSVATLAFACTDSLWAQPQALPPITVSAPQLHTHVRRRPVAAPNRSTGRRARERPAAVEAPSSAPVPRSAWTAMPAYPGNQVATGTAVGFLGNLGNLATPFNVIGYTSELASNQGARTIADVAANDPSVRAIFPRNSYRDVFSIRGFNLFTYNIAYGGLFGMLPKQRIIPEIADRIEILKGPDTFVNGVTTGGSIGGNINIVPKRAPETPIASLTTSFASRSQPSVHLDYGRRFGESNEVGFRFNGVSRSGGLAVEGTTEDIETAVVGLDYRKEKVRLSGDFGYQSQKLTSPDWALTLAPGAARPPIPSGEANLSQPWAFTSTRDSFAVARAEYDLTSAWTVFAALGRSETSTDALLAAPTQLRANGDFLINRFTFPSAGIHTTGEGGIRGQFATGAIDHRFTISGTVWDQDLKVASSSFQTLPSNIFRPVQAPIPNVAGVPSASDLKQTAGNRFSSVAVADNASLFGDKLTITLGGRYQRLEVRGFNGITGIQTSSYDEETITPAFAAVLKIRENVALYANYVEGLQQGPAAPIGAVNFGAVFAPTVAKQTEAGIKVDWGTWTTTLSAFEIRQANGVVDPRSMIFSIDGLQRNRGIEFNVFGELVPGIRILGGYAAIDSVQVRTAGSFFDGLKAVGVPSYNVNLGAELDIPGLRGLSVSGRVIHTASQFFTADNLQSIAPWTRFDLGARYVMDGWNGRPVTMRFNIENLLNENYYASAAVGQAAGISRGAPRTYLLSASTLF